MKFCDNSTCELHIEVSNSTIQRRTYRRIRYDFKEQDFQRNQYYIHGKLFNLCNVCSNTLDWAYKIQIEEEKKENK